MRYRLTSSFIRAMCTEPITNSNTLSFVLYIQACIVRLHCPLRSAAAARMPALALRAAERLPVERVAEMDRQRDSLFARNRADLRGIIDEVWKDKPADPSLKWLGDWNSAIRRYFEELPDLDGGYETISFFAILQCDYPDKGGFLSDLGTARPCIAGLNARMMGMRARAKYAHRGHCHIARL